MTTPAILPPSERYFAPEISKVYFIPTIAAASLAWTRAELAAGDDITGEIADISGFQTQSNMINTPDLKTRFTGMIPGRITADSSSITFYADKGSDDIRAVLPRGTTGYIVFCDGGDVPTQKSDVFPVEVSSVGKVRTTGDQAAQLTVSFAITRKPGEDVAIPA